MNIDMQLGVDGYKTLVSLLPDHYDGHPPLDSIIYQTRMRIRDPNLCAVSSAIVLRDYAADSLTCREPVQAHVAEAIEAFMGGRRFRVGPVDRRPAAIPIGSRRATIGSADSSAPGVTAFSLGDSNSFSSFASIRSVHVASNVPFFFPEDEAGLVVASIAAATFVAPDYAFGEICLGADAAAVVGHDDLLRLRALLFSVNIKLSEECAMNEARAA